MKKIVLVVFIALMLMASATNSWAYTPQDTGVLPQVYQAINQVFINAGLASPALTSNSAADAYQVSGDNYWADLSNQTSAEFAFIGITANNSNTLGVFGVGAPATVQYVMGAQSGYGYIGSGTAVDPYVGGLNPMINEDFGFALRSVDSWSTVGVTTENVWYSDPAYNTIDGLDHMLAYYLPQLDGKTVTVQMGNDLVEVTLTQDTYLLAWEDLPYAGSDLDYNDSIFLVTRVSPAVPEPMSMMLFGTGLVGLLGLRKRA